MAKVPMRKLVFARSAGEVMDTCDLSEVVKLTVSGYSLAFIRSLSIDSIIERPAPRVLAHRQALAIAILRMGTAQALDVDADRALGGVIRVKYNGETMEAIDVAQRTLMSWFGGRST